MAQVRIDNSEDLKRWLDGLEPEERRRQVAAAIACRAALRVVPVLEDWLRKDEEKAIATILLAFRATAASLIVAESAADAFAAIVFTSIADDNETVGTAETVGAAESAFTAAADTAYTAAADAADVTKAAADAAKAAAKAERTAVTDASASASNAFAQAAKAAADDDATTSAAGAAVSAVFAAKTATFDHFVPPDNVWGAVEIDLQFIADGGTALELMLRPLWPGGMPDWARELWASMKQRLLAREGEHWEVWTKWYDVRLDPSRRIPCYSPPIEDLERARVLLPESLWKKGPAAVNAEIKRLIENHECSQRGVDLSQWPAPWQFSVRKGRIVAEPLEGRPDDRQLAEELYHEIKRKAAELAELVQRTNALPDFFRQKVERLQEALGESLDDVKPGILLSRIRSFESGVAAWNTEEGREELSPVIVDAMVDTLLTLNDFKATYPEIIQIEATATAQHLATIEDIEPAKEALAELARVAEQNPQVHDGTRAAEALKDQLKDVELASEEVREAPDAAKPEALVKERRTLAYALMTGRNYVVAAFRGLKQEVGDFGKELFKPGWGKKLGRAVREGVLDGAKSVAKGAVVGMVAFIGYKLAGPLGALAPVVSSLRPLASKAKELREGLEEEEGEASEKDADDDDLMNT